MQLLQAENKQLAYLAFLAKYLANHLNHVNLLVRPQLIQAYSRPPQRHVLTIIDFRDLTAYAYDQEPLRPNADLLADSNFERLGYIDTACLFTWCRPYEDTRRIPVGNLCNLISIRLRDTWDLSIPGNDMELRFDDLWGDTFQVDIGDSGCLAAALARIPNYRIVECHRRVPGVILP